MDLIQHSLNNHATLFAVTCTFLAVATLVAPLLLLSTRVSGDLPDSLPWTGRRQEIFSKTRACLRQYFRGFADLQNGYLKYGKDGKFFILPQPTFHPEVVAPQEHIKWIRGQGEDVLSHRDAQVDRFAIQYLFPPIAINRQPVKDMINALRLNLLRNLSRFQACMMEGIGDSIDTFFGKNEDDWKSICIWETMERTLQKSSLGTLIGEPLCDDEVFVKSWANFQFWFGIGTTAVGCYTPALIQPLLGYLFRIPIDMSSHRCLKQLVPVIKERWEKVESLKTDLSFEDEIPDDFMTCLVKGAIEGKENEINSPKLLAQHLLFLTVAAFPTTVIMSTNTLLDLVSSLPEHYERIREEAEMVLGGAQHSSDMADKILLTKLHYTDSAIRESMRLNPLFTLTHKVVDKDGLTLPDGTHLHQGCYTAIPVTEIHLDEKFYPNAKEYHPFRFVLEDQGLQPENKCCDTSTSTAQGDRRSNSLVSTSDTFMSFGIGRHTCAGRHLASNQMKILLSYITLHYDVKPLGKRPPNRKIGDMNVPSRWATIQVRRRNFF